MAEVSNHIDQKSLHAYYESFFSDADLITIKAGIYQMPIEKVYNSIIIFYKP